MSIYWSSLVKKIQPYVPGEQPQDKKYIKLNTNENPYPPSPLVLEALKKAADETLRLYPDPNGTDLRKTIARYHQLDQENIFLGNGSDEVLAFCFQAFFDPDRPILFPDVTYSFYPVYAALFQQDYQLVSLDHDFAISPDSFKRDNGGIVFPNPNAPTGRCLDLSEIEDIVRSNPQSVVIVDEAYIDFGGDTAIPLIKDYPNLLVVQTMSKSRSLAGLRVGYALGHLDLIQGLNRIKNSFNSYPLDRLALMGAQAAIKDEAYFQQTRKQIIATRDGVGNNLLSMGFQVVPSQANFIFIRHDEYEAESLYLRLKEKGVLVRYFKKPRIDNYLRVSIGTDAEMSVFINSLKEIMAEEK